MIEGTRQILGDDGFAVFIDELFDRYAYDNISAGVHRPGRGGQRLHGGRLELLGDFYEQWLYGTEEPTILPRPSG